ncbi:hypothetical protein HOLleu_44470 [Holothuria leucospilota]|uniref:Uncharacterized protein n=1 Tax=Holothuria leucospilota TaxID=206669 RepID=A0A9Q0Y8U1_HOLLE|nr:hypothetical protein HOLleu_44470 [Holothuria leucospilota]
MNGYTSATQTFKEKYFDWNPMKLPANLPTYSFEIPWDGIQGKRYESGKKQLTRVASREGVGGGSRDGGEGMIHLTHIHPLLNFEIPQNGIQGKRQE